MILVDELGNKIYSSIHYSLIPKFGHLLEEGAFRLISNFEVKSTDTTFLLAKHACKINFLKETSVSTSNAFEINGDLFDFCPFEKINNSTVDKKASFDVIGQVIESKPIRITESRNVKKHILEFQLCDDKGTIVSCALWDDYAHQFHQYISTNGNIVEPVIILLQLAKYNFWNSKFLNF
uniref:uncharacterized protein LOC122587932 n=1 Tax=Erigeron canadensis TaxID=72917 RepID=UPI001CB90EDB|nr:uncharacterized protein LOC122587932 [Erigeron canadensis]